MAAAFGESEGEAEGSVTGAAAAASSRVLATEWREEERFEEVNGFSIILSRAMDAAAIKVEAMQEAADHMFAGQFDSEGMVSGGFNPVMEFDKCVEVIIGGLKGDAPMTASLKTFSADAIDLVIRVSVACFEATYKLRLYISKLDAVRVMSTKLMQAQTDCETAKLQLAAMRKEFDETKAEMEDLRAEIRIRDACIAKLGMLLSLATVASKKCETLKRQLAEIKSQMSKTKAEAAAECLSAKKEVEEMRAEMNDAKAESAQLMSEIRMRDARIAESQKILSQATAASKKSTDGGFGTEQRVDESTAFLFDMSISGGYTLPERFKVSKTRKTATFTHEIQGQILLTPAVSKGTHSLEFHIKEITGALWIGVLDDYSERVYMGCAFDNDGNVGVNGQYLVKRQSFGNWKNGDRITLIADFSSDKLTIKAPNGNYSVDIESLGTPLWFAFFTDGTGTSVSVVT